MGAGLVEGGGVVSGVGEWWRVRLHVSSSDSNNNFLVSHHSVHPNKLFGRRGEEGELRRRNLKVQYLRE